MLEKIKLFTVTYSATKYYEIEKDLRNVEDFMFIIWDGWNPELKLEIRIFFCIENSKCFCVSINPEKHLHVEQD